jgi:hypothetical protein
LAVALAAVLVVVVVDPFPAAKTVVKASQVPVPRLMTPGHELDPAASAAAKAALLHLVVPNGADHRPWSPAVRGVDVFRDRPGSLYVMTSYSSPMTAASSEEVVGDMCHLALQANPADNRAAVFTRTAGSGQALVFQCQVMK